MSDFKSLIAGLGLAVDRPAKIFLKHPGTGQPLTATVGDKVIEAFVEGISFDSKVPEIAANEEVAKIRLGRQGVRTLSAADNERIRVASLAAMVSAWCIIAPTGEHLDVQCTNENARALFSDRGWAWLRGQVERGLDDRGNFMPAPKS